MTPGAASSEFKAVLGALIGAGTAVLQIEDRWTRIAAMACGTVVLVAYVWSRTRIKQAEPR